MASKLVNIVKAFTLTIVQDGEVLKKRIEAGLNRLEQDVADHWFTKAHTADVPDEAAEPVVEPVAKRDDSGQASKSSKK